VLARDGFFTASLLGRRMLVLVPDTLARRTITMDAATRERTSSTKFPRPRPDRLTVPAFAICYPGVYVTQHGHMVRVFEELAEQEGPMLGWESFEGTLVTRVTADPRLPIQACRELAADAGLPVRF
jgi:hypothetical protein